MSTTIRIKRGTATKASSYVGQSGELVYVTDNNTVRVYDGNTTGGAQLAMNDVVLGIIDAITESGETAVSSKADKAELTAVQSNLQQQIANLPNQVIATADELYIKKADLDVGKYQYNYWS